MRQSKEVLYLRSGGAAGADYQWTKQCVDAGLPVDVLSYKDHKRTLPDDISLVNIMELSFESLREYNSLVNLMSGTYPWRRPIRRRHTRRLMQRTAKLAHVDQYIGVGVLEGEGWIAGGTGWGFDMYLEVVKQTPDCFPNGPEAWFFNQDTCEWSQVMGHDDLCRPVFQLCDTPVFTGPSVGLVGTRKLTSVGTKAIRHCVLKSVERMTRI